MPKLIIKGHEVSGTVNSAASISWLDKNGIVSNVQAEFNGIQDNLTASDNTPFKFAVNKNGEYGYIVTDSEGVDTFHPFKNLVRDTQVTATAEVLTEGCTAWVNGELIVGTRPAPVIALSGQFTFDYWANTTYTKNVLFDTPFDDTPTVTYSLSFQKNQSHCTGHKVSNVTKNGFKLTMYGDGQGVWGYCYWSARL